MRLRAGVARLQVETGRYTGTVRCDRICNMCDWGVVEDEEHFVEECGAWEAETGYEKRDGRDRCPE